VGGDVVVDSETLSVADFVNLKIKPAQFFRCAHRGMVCLHVFIGVSAHMCMSIYVCTVFLKKIIYNKKPMKQCDQNLMSELLSYS
jgi:hypothetical protein